MAKYVIMVSGCRHYTNYYAFAKKMDKLISRFPRKELMIIEGGAKGVDYLAYLYAMRRGIKCLSFPADWDGQGKAAGFIRNTEMLGVATHCVTFWDKVSPGTRHVVDNVHRYPISYRNILIAPEDKSHGKPKSRHRTCRQYDGRTVSRIRKRHAAALGFGTPVRQ